MRPSFHFSRSRQLAFLVGLGAFLLGALVSAGVFFFILPSFQLHTNAVYQFDNKYHLISPLLACSTDQNIDQGQAKELENQIQASIQSRKDVGDILSASVYFQDLSGGPIVTVNADQPFDPGSLLKVPLAMSVYKDAESDPSILTKLLDYTGAETDDPQHFPAPAFSPGQYSVADLVSHMLVYSDNNAANVLANAIGPDAFTATYQHLGVPPPPVDGTDYTITTRAYASFLRILYNATYLDDDSSEQLLQTLSQATFKDGIVAGVPSGTVVAHKFGERSFTDTLDVQLHDCGIVYAPNHPYILCVMTEGTDFNKLAATIASLSNLAYNYVE